MSESFSQSHSQSSSASQSISQSQSAAQSTSQSYSSMHHSSVSFSNSVSNSKSARQVKVTELLWLCYSSKSSTLNFVSQFINIGIRKLLQMVIQQELIIV